MLFSDCHYLHWQVLLYRGFKPHYGCVSHRANRMDDTTGRPLALDIAREVTMALDAETREELRTSEAATGRKRWRAEDEQQQHKRRMMVRRLEIARDQRIQLVAFLQRRQTAQVPPSHADEDSPRCTICLGTMQSQTITDGDSLLEALSCGHVFHRRCISRWVSYNRCCPIDRQPVD
jgi:hypothetical protein